MLRRGAIRLLGSLLGESAPAVGSGAGSSSANVHILNNNASHAAAFASANPVINVLQVAALNTSAPVHESHKGVHGITYPAPEAFVGQTAPSFSCPAVVDGDIKTVTLDDYKGKWKILFFYPKDFTFVCPTEIIAFNDRRKEFEALNCQLIAASCDSPEVHLAWIRTPRKKGGLGHMEIPVISDMTKEVSAKYGVLLKDLGIPLRGLFLIDEENVVQQITVNALPIGRSVDEALRLLQASQYFKEHGEVCPANWKPGQPSMIADPQASLDYFGAVHKDEAEEEVIAPTVPLAKTPEDFKAAITSGKKTVAMFSADWCGKCRQISPTVEDLQKQYKSKGVTFIKVNTERDGFAALVESLGVKALPNFRFFNGAGQEVHEPVTGMKRVPLAEAVASLSKA